MDEYRETLMDLEDAAYRLLCGTEMLLAIHTAMAEGPFTADSYTDAIYGVFLYLQDSCKEIRDGVYSAFKGKREEKRA